MLQKVDKRCCCALLLGGQITNCKAVIIKDVQKNLVEEIFLCPPHTINFDKHNWHKGSGFLVTTLMDTISDIIFFYFSLYLDMSGGGKANEMLLRSKKSFGKK